VSSEYPGSVLDAKQQAVLYIDGEMPAGVLQERMVAMLKVTQGDVEPKLAFLSYDLPGSL
jgi:hypothetical protein